MVVVSMLPHAEIGWNDHRERAPQFKSCRPKVTIKKPHRFLQSLYHKRLTVKGCVRNRSGSPDLNMITVLCAGRARSAMPAITMVHFQNGAQKKIVFGPASWCQMVFIGPFGKLFATNASPAPHNARYNLVDIVIRVRQTFLSNLSLYGLSNSNETKAE